MKVLVTSDRMPVSDADLAELDGTGARVEVVDGTDVEALRTAAADASALLVLAESIDRPLIEAMPLCRSITRFGVGYDTVDIEAATEHGIQVTNVPDANYREVAVHAIALALAVSRRLPQLDRGIRADGWTSSIAPGVHRPDVQVFGLLGLGRIGRRVAEMARVIGYTVIASDPAITTADAAELGVELTGVDDLLARSDVLSLHVPLLESTRDVIDAGALAAMRPGAVLVNVSRGGLIDEPALAEAVRSGHLLGAGLDAFSTEPLDPESPLRGVDGILLSPHAAHWSEESWEETRRKAFADTARMLRGEHPLYPVNRIAEWSSA